MLLLALPLVSGPGCRCSSSTPEEPAPTGSTKPPSTPRCPAQPSWAGDPAEPEKLVVELLMQPRYESTKKGTGIRIYEDGRVFAYDDVYFETRDGKMTPRPIEGKWRQHKTLGQPRVEALKALVAQLPRGELVDWQGKERTGKGKPSLMNVRHQGEVLRSCYRGVEGGEAQQRVDKLTKTLMGEAYDDAVNR
ncbi:MAG: hypothetical protein MUF64_04935 [Polyangiaceae bacterium]|nr:hypothetical protein [Polyangiaceae bacterium]